MPPRSAPSRSSRRQSTQASIVPEEMDQETEEEAMILEVERRLDAMSTLANKAQTDMEEDVDEDGYKRTSRSLSAQCELQRGMLELGPFVGSHGTPAQIVQDARLFHQINNQTIPAIKSIEIGKSVWNSKVFHKRLMSELCHACVDPDDYDPEDEQTLTGTFCQTFVDEFIGDFLCGFAPELSTVYGATKAVVPPKPKAEKPPTQTKSANEKHAKPKNVEKLSGNELNANVDPTMQRVNNIYNIIQSSYLATGKPLCLISLLIQRNSYQDSVTNFFCFSFLLRDGKVRMSMDEHQLPICLPVQVTNPETEEEEPVPDSVQNRTQEDKFKTIMMNLSESTWKQLIKDFDLRMPPVDMHG